MEEREFMHPKMRERQSMSKKLPRVTPILEKDQAEPLPISLDPTNQPTSGLMSLKLIDSSISTAKGPKPDSKSLVQSPSSSMGMKTSCNKRRLEPSTCIWPKSKRLKSQSSKRERNVLEESEHLKARGWSKPWPQKRKTMSELRDLVRKNHRSLLMKMKNNQGRRENYDHQTCRGMVDMGIQMNPSIQAALNQPTSSENSIEISSQQSYISDSHLEHQGESPCRNGNISSKESPSTLTKCSPPSTALLLIRRERLALERQKLVLEELKSSGKLRRVLNGLPLGDPLRERLLSYSNTDKGNSPIMVTTSKGCSQQKDQDHMVKLSCTTKALGTKSEGVKPCYLPTTIASHPYTPPPCKTTELNIIEVGEGVEEESQEKPKEKCVSGSTAKTAVGLRSQLASTNIPANHVVKLGTVSHLVERGIEEDPFGMRPRYLKHNLWMMDSDPKVTAADWTITARPLPRPPVDEFANKSVLNTIVEHPDLFKIVSPVKAEVLERLTQSHPNRLFVESVVEGIRKGFWPWASTNKEGYPLTHDESKPIRLEKEKEEFLMNQIEHEQGLERMSKTFGGNLLPGMYCMPHYVVLKPHASGLRLVNDLSAGPFSLNSMVDRQFITGFPLDNLSHLGELLLRKHKENPHSSFVVWKSDVAEAYHICPVHELWQMKQIIKVQGKFIVDRVNIFGGSGSGPIFISLNSLVAWIARYERNIEDLVYVDDSFGVEEEGVVAKYEPYNEAYPLQQTRLLKLWDELGIPHKQKKQVYGCQLMVLGIEVDVEHLTFTLPSEAKEHLLKELSEWCGKGVRRKVKEWQQLAGWINWVLNVYPLLRPALNNIYAKIKGKEQEARVWANSAIREDLTWAKGKVDQLSGVRLLKSYTWEPEEATCVAKTDACPLGIAFWYPDKGLGFAASTPQGTPATQITFYEALAVLSALEEAQLRYPPESKILIYTDNFSTVAMFNSFKSLPEYNCILKAAVNILISADFRLRVLHIPGEDNVVADALSRSEFMRALRVHPGLTIRAFEPSHRVDRHQLPPTLQPPRQTLGATIY